MKTRLLLNIPFLKVLLIGGAFLGQTTRAEAQTKIQVVTQTIDKEFAWRQGDGVRIGSEKATIEVKGWDKNYVKVRLRLIAKHPVREVAEQELKHLKYSIRKSGSTIDLLNYFLIEKGAGQIRSNLKAHYEVWVPTDCGLNITSKYGETFISHTTGKQVFDLNFSKLTLSEVRGEVRVQSVFGDLTGINTDINLVCRAEKADIDLSGAAGAYRVENKYGKININATSGLKEVNIKSARTEVALSLISFIDYNYELATSHAPILLPPPAGQLLNKAGSGKNMFQLGPDPLLPSINISTTYSPITIKTLTHEIAK
ncbi:hypothetical protein BH24BAC1_BH24BAC1_36450 [soil metagenome]